MFLGSFKNGSKYCWNDPIIQLKKVNSNLIDNYFFDNEIAFAPRTACDVYGYCRVWASQWTFWMPSELPKPYKCLYGGSRLQESLLNLYGGRWSIDMPVKRKQYQSIRDCEVLGWGLSGLSRRSCNCLSQFVERPQSMTDKVEKWKKFKDSRRESFLLFHLVRRRA